MAETITSFKHDLGVTARDPISGFEGIIVTRVHYLFGCSSYGIAPKELNSDGQVRKTEYFEEARIEVTDASTRREGPSEFDKIFLHPAGADAKEKITGFEGKITYRIEYLHSCNQYGLMPPVDKDGKTRESEQYDEGRIEIKGAGIKPEDVAAPRRGGIGHRDAPSR